MSAKQARTSLDPVADVEVRESLRERESTKASTGKPAPTEPSNNSPATAAASRAERRPYRRPSALAEKEL